MFGAQVVANATERARLHVDMRPAGRFTGSVPEPRAGMRSGHVPRGEGHAPREAASGVFAGSTGSGHSWRLELERTTSSRFQSFSGRFSAL